MTRTFNYCLLLGTVCCAFTACASLPDLDTSCTDEGERLLDQTASAVSSGFGTAVSRRDWTCAETSGGHAVDLSISSMHLAVVEAKVERVLAARGWKPAPAVENQVFRLPKTTLVTVVSRDQDSVTVSLAE